MYTNRTIIKMLDSIPKFETYSQYSSSLEKVFKDYSFKHLLKVLHEQKKPEIYSYFNVDEKVQETNNIFQGYDKQKKDDFENNLLHDEEENDIKLNSEKDNNLTERKTWKSLNTTVKKRYNPQLDPFRYNPNYNAIFKNIPCARISKPLKATDKNFLKKPVENAFLTEIGSKTMTQYIGRNKKSNYSRNLNILENMKKRRGVAKTESNEDKHNHSIRFDKYVDRKDNVSKVNPKISYIEPYNYLKVKNNSIDFNKMQSRNEQLFYNLNNFNGPSIGYYDLKYNCQDKKLRNLSFGNDRRKEKDKKFLLKKIWGSYDVKADYQLIDNNKLRNTHSIDN